MGRILIIESDDRLAETLEELLVSAGHEVSRTGSGRTGLMLAARTSWDVALLGLRSDELAGQGVLRVLNDLSGVPVVVMSASAAPGWRREAFDAGAAACVDKPFQPRTLLALIDAIRAGGPRELGPPGDVRQLGAEDLDRIRRMSHSQAATPEGAGSNSGKRAGRAASPSYDMG